MLRRRTGFTEEQIEKYSQEYTNKLYDLLYFLEKELTDNIIKVTYELSVTDNKLFISKLAISNSKEKLIIQIVSHKDLFSVDSEIIKIDNADQQIILNYYR